jgi:hypothetical protein
MDSWFERPDSTHTIREALDEFGLAAIAELLEIRIRGVELRGAPVVAGPKPTDRDLVKVQLVQLILAGQVPVVVAATVVGSFLRPVFLSSNLLL